METNRRTYSLAVARRRSHLWWLLAALTLAVGGILVKPVAAQQNAADKILNPADLQNVVGPIALYPDDLVGIVLPASTYPLQIVEAERFIDKRKQDPSLKPNQDWDDSVVALLNYPEVVKQLSGDLDWTWDLGTAVLNQRTDVLDAIQSFRTRARDAGNLRSDDRQTVAAQDDGSIAIAPADPQVIYVPYYEPERVVVYQQEPVYSYYPYAYPVYYYPYPAGYRFRTGAFWGVTSYFGIGWHSRLINVHYWGHDDFPYYGWNYYAPFYARNYINVNINVPRGGSVWEPRHRYGDRPSVPIVRGREGRVADSRTEPHVAGGMGQASRYRNAPNGNVPATTAPRAGGVAGSASRARPPQQNAAPAAAASQANRNGATAAGGDRDTNRGVPPNRTGNYRPGGGMSQASKQNDASQRSVTQPPRATPAPQTESRDNPAASRYRVPTAPDRQPQSATPSPQREYRGMSSASRYSAAPQMRSAPPPRAESFTSAPSRGVERSAPRNEGGSSRGGGGGERAQHHGGGNGGGRGGERSGGERGESRGR